MKMHCQFRILAFLSQTSLPEAVLFVCLGCHYLHLH